VQITFSMADFQPVYFQSLDWLLAFSHRKYIYIHSVIAMIPLLQTPEAGPVCAFL